VDPFLTFTGTFPFFTFSNTSAAETPAFNNLMPDGLYTIRLIVKDGNSCRDSMDMMINKTGSTFNNITLRKSVACEGSTGNLFCKSIILMQHITGALRMV